MILKNWRRREPIVSVNDDLEFKGAQLAQEVIQREFQSDQLRQIFEQTIDKNKRSGSVSADLVIWGIGLGGGGGVSKRRVSEITAEETKSKGQSYVSTVHYQLVPIKSIHLTYKDIELKPDAITELKNIEKKIKLVRYKANGQFRSFFERYGSHVHYGLIELGGILIATASCQGFEESRRTKMTEMTATASKTFASLGFRHSIVSAQQGTSIKASELKSKESLNYHENDLKQITLSLKKIGGPDDINDKQEWTRELERNSSLWRVISRKSNPKPIWELLRKYEDKFESHALLAHAMEEEWKKETQMRGSSSKRRIEDLRRDIALWAELNRKEQNMVEGFKELSGLRHKHKIMDEDWRDEVLYSQEIQDLLVKAIDGLRDEKDHMQIQQAVTYLRDILHPVNKIGTQRFPEVKNIMQKMIDAEKKVFDPDYFEVDDIVKLPKVLKDKVENLKAGDLQSKLGNIQQNLENILKNWSKKPKKTYEYLVCLGVIRLFGFNLHEFQFEFNLLKKDFDGIISALDKYLSNLGKITDTPQKQAFIFNLVLSCSTKKNAGVKYFKEHMPDKLCKSLAKVFKDNDTFDLPELQIAISDSIDNEFSKVDLKALVQSLKTQLHFTEAPTRTPQKASPFQMGNLDRPVEKLLESLELSKYYPQKLTYDDVIKLTSELLEETENNLTSLSELPWYFMKHIIGVDSGTRENCHLSVIGEQLPTTTKEETEDKESDDSDDDIEISIDDENDDYDDVDTDGVFKSDDNAFAVHPLDLTYAIFLCADDFLRQELLDKMLRCQYAVPFILPSAQRIQEENKPLILHWGLQSMRRSYHYHNTVENKSLVDVECPFISFVNIGEETSWKSKLLNKMLSPQQETFWHQGLKGGDRKQKISQGMVEVAWYLPGGRKDDKSPRPLTFANLRGNLQHFPVVTDMLLTSSSANVVFTENLNDDLIGFLKQQKKVQATMVLVVLSKKSGGKARKVCDQIQKKLKFEKHQIILSSVEDASFNKLYEELSSSLTLILKRKKETVVSLAEFAKKASDNFNISTDDKQCYYGQKAAERILRDIDEINEEKAGRAKSIILPCQSNIEARQEIAALEKEMCRQRKQKEGTTVERYKENIRDKIWKVKLDQLKHPISDTYRYFLKCLISLGKDDRKYFLQYLKLGLNDRSVQYLEPLYEQYAQCRLEDDSAEKEQKLQEIDKQLNHGSLGLEHFFREMAVLYENLVALKRREKTDDLDNAMHLLTTAMAELFMDGTAIEIMDGDAVTVPVRWLKAVLEKVPDSKKTKLFKVSVLGAQSCGKSTLLNTIFGLNFPVSSGRCTRGAYMQLVKVEGELKKILGCDYVLVIDSEGLMSRAMSSRSDYDNELSTFIIGLSDLTLVIIKGEGNEMQDVLPLAIHVFLRMTIVGEYQSCHFVHQNMGAVDAMSKVASEIDAFVRDLNMKTLAAAIDTGQTEQYTKFTDVLHYDPTTDNTYVPGLWDGTPPMGKTNAEYSGTMESLKIQILKLIKDIQLKHKSMSSIRSFVKRLYELWEAIKFENFVFSFKNVLAFEAHKKLSKEFDSKRWIMKREVRKKTKQEETAITKEVINTNSGTNVRDLINVSIQAIIELISERGERMMQKLQHYFNCTNGCDDCNKDIQNRHLLARYQDEFEKDVEFLKKALEQELRSAMDKLELKLNADKTINKMKSGMHEHLKKTIQTVIDSQKQASIQQQDMQAIFKEFWKKETKTILRDIKFTDELDPTTIRSTVEQTIKKLLGSDVYLYTRTRSQDDIDKRKQAHKKSEKKKFPLEKGKSLDAANLSATFRVQKEHFDTKKVARERNNSLTEKDEAVKGSDETEAETSSSNKKTQMMGFVKKKMNRGTDKDILRLTDISSEIIEQAKKHYEDETKAFTEKEAENLFEEVLRLINGIDEEKFVITKTYKGHLIIHIENMAVEGFNKMHARYMKTNSPKALLKELEEKYHTLFVMEMTQGANAALEFCEKVLKGIILENVKEQLNSTELLDDLRKNGSDIFKNIKSLQATAMIELIKEDFDSYMDYITNYKSFMSQFLDTKCKDHFKKEHRLHELAKKSAESIIRTILKAVEITVENPSTDDTFVDLLLGNMTGLTVSQDYSRPFDDLTISDWKQFGTYLHQNLSGRMKKSIFEEIEEFDVEELLDDLRLTEFILEEIVSCKARCPLCYAPCDSHSGGRTQGDHSATMHRSPGIIGYKHKNDKRLFTESCNVLVASKEKFKIRDGKTHLTKYKPFKDYKKYYPKWLIHADDNSDVEKYWKWILAEHNEKFADKYGTKKATIPEEWNDYDTEEIIRELREAYLDEDEMSDRYSLYSYDDTDPDDNDALLNSYAFSMHF